MHFLVEDTSSRVLSYLQGERECVSGKRRTTDAIEILLSRSAVKNGTGLCFIQN